MQNLFHLLFGFALSEQETLSSNVKLNHCKKVCVFNGEEWNTKSIILGFSRGINPGHQGYDELLYTRPG